MRQSAFDCIFAWYSGLFNHAKSQVYVLMKKDIENDVFKFLAGKNPKGKEFVNILPKIK